MREIKFRAWDGQHMFHCGIIGLADLMEIEHIKLELMQYTGIRDKNGKEIYEEDIVRWDKPEWDEMETKTSVVKYAKCGFSPFKDYSVVDNGNIDDNQIDHIDLEYEVIGNIYENPELLSTDTDEKED